MSNDNEKQEKGKDHLDEAIDKAVQGDGKKYEHEMAGPMTPAEKEKLAQVKEEEQKAEEAIHKFENDPEYRRKAIQEVEELLKKAETPRGKNNQSNDRTR